MRGRWGTLGTSATALALATLVTLVPAGVAAAAPVDGTTQHSGSSASLEVLSERYNYAVYRTQRTIEALHETNQLIRATNTRIDALRALTRARAAGLYQRAAGGIATIIPDGTPNEVARRGQYMSAADRPDWTLIHELGATQKRLKERRVAQRAARDQLKNEAAAAASAKRQLLAEAAAQAKAAVAPTGDGAGPVGTPRSVAAAPAAAPPAPAPAPAAPGPSPAAPAPPPPPPPPAPPRPPAPPSTSRGQTAVNFARAQLGKPYAFATSGPNTFDCSGLTMAAWAAAGVRMPHYSGSQAAMFPKVSWEQLAPGDIVVFYSDFHHVGLYIGGGQMIHAPQTGDVVRVAPAWRTTFMFGVRPG